MKGSRPARIAFGAEVGAVLRQPTEPKAYTVAELAAARGVSVLTVRRWIYPGVRGVRLEHGFYTPRQPLITQTQVDAFLAALAEQTRQKRCERQAAKWQAQRGGGKGTTRKAKAQTDGCLRLLGMQVG